MNARTTVCFLVIISIAASVGASEVRPVAISPGSDEGIAEVAQGCPTFSWTSVEWALSYRVAVFETNGADILSYEEIEAISSPVLSKEIRGRALSWTPSSDERLGNGGVYVWYVQALDGYGTGIWSEGRMFEVEAEVQLLGMEEVVKESLREHGMSEEAIEDTLEEIKLGMKGVVAYGVDAEGNEGGALDKIGIQGYEGSYNTFYGLGAGDYIEDHGGSGIQNSFLGYVAGYWNNGGNSNTFLGHSAGYYNTTGDSNTFIGSKAGEYNTNGSFNIFIGHRTGYNNTNGMYNIFIGHHAGYNANANDNTFIGYNAGNLNTIGNANTFVGSASGQNNTEGYSNLFMGYAAGHNNTLGYQNTFLGRNAGYYNTTGSYNTFIGFSAGSHNTGGGNTFLGSDSGYEHTSGSFNTFIGDRAGYHNTTGDMNVFLGSFAGYNNISGEFNVFLGRHAGYNETGSSKLYIDNTETSSPLIWGDFASNILTVHGKFGVGTKSPAYAMELETTGENAAFVAQRTDGATNYINATASFGNFGTVTNHPLRLAVNSLWRMRLDSDDSLTMRSGATCTAGGKWVDSSSRSLKENIRSLTAEEAERALEGLEPVRFNYKADREEENLGFIAEDVPELVASKDRDGMSAMDVVAVLTKIVQEQQKAIDNLRKQVENLKKVSK